MVPDAQNLAIRNPDDDYDDGILDTAIDHFEDDDDGANNEGVSLSVHHHDEPDHTHGAIEDYVYNGDIEELAQTIGFHFNNDGELATELDGSFNVKGRHVVNADSRGEENHQAVAHSEQADTGIEAHEQTYLCIYCLSDSKNEDLVFVDLGLPCGHQACLGCLNMAARQSMVSRLTFPPECGCIADNPRIDLVALEEHLDADNRTRLAACKDEYTSVNPTWCFNPTCSIFLRVDDATDSGDQFLTCRACGEQTCTKCKALKTAHAGPLACPDLLSAQDKALIATENWKQCPNENCKKVIDRSQGCNIMNCPCGTTFCWQCLQILNDEEGSASCRCFEDQTDSE